MLQAKLMTIILGVALAVTGSIADAEEHEGHGGMSHEKMGGMMGKGHMMMHGMHSFAHLVAMHADVLKLSDEQLGKITRLHLQQMKEHQDTMNKLHKSMMDFRMESMKAVVDEATLRNLAKEHANAFNAMVDLMIKERNEVNAVLTPEQQAQLKSLKMEHPMGMESMGKGMSSEHGMHKMDDKM